MEGFKHVEKGNLKIDKLEVGRIINDVCERFLKLKDKNKI